MLKAKTLSAVHVHLPYALVTIYMCRTLVDYVQREPAALAYYIREALKTIYEQQQQQRVVLFFQKTIVILPYKV